VSLLVDAFENLPQRARSDDPDLHRAGAEEAVMAFLRLVRDRYSEGTLGRILTSHHEARHRRAAVVALGLIGTMSSNAAVAEALKDDDEQVRISASESIWELWFRGDGGRQGLELRQAVGLPETDQRSAACDDLIREYPDFAEAYNQRAIQHFVRGSYSLAVSDCEAVLRLNPYHFGSAAGMGQCYLRMNKPRAAIRAFAHALDLNPGLPSLQDVLDTLRDTLGES
jgi:tetratricopeptide (TPR) repeat protein